MSGFRKDLIDRCIIIIIFNIFYLTYWKYKHIKFSKNHNTINKIQDFV